MNLKVRILITMLLIFVLGVVASRTCANGEFWKLPLIGTAILIQSVLLIFQLRESERQ